MMEAINAMSYIEFISVFGSVLEHCQLGAATVWSDRPFSGPEDIHHAFTTFLASMDSKAKAGIIRCYPDLAGKMAQEDELTRDSLEEHKAAGLLDLTVEEKEEMSSLNDTYKGKFGFPFVICARENKKMAIFEGLRARLENDPPVEVNAAIHEIGQIAYHRINNIVIDNAKL